MGIRVTINGKEEELPQEMSVMELLRSRGVEPRMVAVEINGEMVEKEDYEHVQVREGDQVEFLYFMGGGLDRPSPVSDALSLIGDTPLVRLSRFSEDGAEIFAKLESRNPGGSVKDRICLSMIEAAEREGRLRPGSTIVEPTSGNTGIGLALVAAVKGYRTILVMPESMSTERLGLLASFGAEVVLTPAIEGMKGSIAEAERLLERYPDHFMPDQFSNPANPEIHRRTTAVEIWEQTGGEIDAFVAGVGTGGTITGVGEVLKARNPQVWIVAVEPASSPVLSGGSPGPHKIQGIGAGFIPRVLNRDILDEVIPVSDDEAFETAKRIWKEEGLMVGISSGANVFAAWKVAQRLGKGRRVVTILPDTGERYISIEKYFRV